MEVKDLKANHGNVIIELDIVSKEEPREFEKFGKVGKVCNVVGKDDTGEIKISLWNEQADLVNVGDRIKIDNGWVSEWQGKLQLSTGKFGKLEVIGKSDATSSTATENEDKSKENNREIPAVDEEIKEEQI